MVSLLAGNPIRMPNISANKLLPTTLVGSYPQPDWLIDRKRLTDMVPPRAHAPELWRVEPSLLEQAQNDATILAIRDQERAGIDVVTDGEIRRESYSNRFATALDGMDSDNPAQVPSRTPGRFQTVPRVVGKIRRLRPVQVKDVTFLRANTERPIKITIPGPFTMTQQLLDEYYKDEAAVAMDCAAALNDEIKDLFAAGADVVQLDEPFLQAQPDKARRFGVAAINRALDGVKGTTAVHLCFGYAARVKEKPSGYSFLPELEGDDSRSDIDRDRGVEARLRDAGEAAGQADRAGGDRSPGHDGGDARDHRRAHPPRHGLCAAGAHRAGAGLRHEISAARRRVRQAQGDGRRRGDGAWLRSRSFSETAALSPRHPEVRALSALTRVFDALWRASKDGRPVCCNMWLVQQTGRRPLMSGLPDISS